MTGYGRGNNENFVVEIQSVNNRYCTVDVKLPDQLFFFEPKIKEIIKSNICRGKLFVVVKCVGTNNTLVKVGINLKVAEGYLNVLKELGKNFNLKDDLKLSHFITFKDILYQEQSIDKVDTIWLYLEEALLKAIEGLVEMRSSEGRAIYADITNRVGIIEKLLKGIKQQVKGVVHEYRKKLQKRITEIIGNTEGIDLRRLTMEVALYTDKVDITEEITRFESHLDAFKNCLIEEESVGRQLDFLVQELNREANTICGKTGNIKIIHNAVAIKTELEKIREQLQNVE